MKRFVVLVARRCDTYDRYWIIRNTREAAEKVAKEYERNNEYQCEIIESLED